MRILLQKYGQTGINFYDLLDNFDLTDRIIDKFDEIEHKLLDIIDYNKTNELIKQTRKSSYKYIKACLEDASHE